jgi:hypothetical protein
MISFRPCHLVAIVVPFICSVDARELGDSTEAPHHAVTTTVPVAGSGVHFLTTALVHSRELTQTGMIQKSTETVDLDGDLKGRVLYHVTSVFDFVGGTLVNTGHQVYSGTIARSAPVMIHDGQFRFEVNLNTGATVGEVHFTDRIAGPKVWCDLVVVGTGAKTAEGNLIADYTGTCTFRGQR